MNKEDFFISQFQSDVIGDDGAVIGKWVYSKDLFFEDVHFKKEWMSLEQIAKKAMLVNLSDAVAMNAKPKYILIGIQIPKHYSKKELKMLYRGFKKVSKEFDCDIIGGDTIAGEKLCISITVISKTKRAVLRHGIQEGDLLFHTGILGSAKKDLELLLEEKAIDTKNSKFITPKLRVDFMKKSAKYMNACLDISDGLGFELERLSKANQIGFILQDDFSFDILCSGEEYELLFAISPQYQKKLLQVAKKLKIPLHFVAIASKSEKLYHNPCKAHHF